MILIIMNPGICQAVKSFTIMITKYLSETVAKALLLSVLLCYDQVPVIQMVYFLFVRMITAVMGIGEVPV